MGEAELEARLLHKANEASDPANRKINADGKRREVDFSRQRLQRDADTVLRLAGKYPEDLQKATAEAAEKRRQPPRWLQKADDSMAKAAPQRRKQYESNVQGKALVVPLSKATAATQTTAASPPLSADL